MQRYKFKVFFQSFIVFYFFLLQEYSFAIGMPKSNMIKIGLSDYSIKKRKYVLFK